MKKMLFWIMVLPISFCFADEQEIADAIQYVSEKSGIDARIYYSIIDVESNFKPYTIGMVVNSSVLKAMENLPSATYNVKASKYNSRSYFVSAFSNNEEDIIGLAKALYKFDFNIDMGLMQISKQHVKEDELEFIFNPKYNLIKGNNIFAECVKKYKVLSQSIECYNKGFNKKNALQYYRKFVNSFNRHFGKK